MRTTSLCSAAATIMACHLLAGTLAGCGDAVTARVAIDPPAVDLHASAVALDRDGGVVADGVDAATIAVTVRRADGTTVPGISLALQVSGTGNELGAATATHALQLSGTGSDPGAATATTGADGTASVALRSTVAERKTVTVTLPDGGTLAATPQVVFVAGPPARLRFVAQPAAATASVAFAPVAAVAIEDAQGNRACDSTATLQLDLQLSSSTGVLLGTTAVAATQGLASFSGVAAAAAAAAVRLAVSGEGLATVLSAPFTVAVGAPAPPTLVYATLTATPGTQLADGVALIAATLALRSSDGLQAMPNATVAWSMDGTGNALGAGTGTTNYAGVATVTLASTVAQAKTLTAVADGRTFTAPVIFTAGNANNVNSTLTVTAGPTPADGVATASIVASWRDDFANPIPGAAVIVTVDGQGNVLTPSGGSGTTDATGSFSVTVASTHAGSKAVSAALGGITLAGVAPFAVPVCSGTVTFAYTTTALAQGVFDGVAGDYDNDGHLDLAMISNQGRAVYVMRGGGDGTFAAADTYALASGTAIVQGDFTGDNHLDLVAIDQPNNQGVLLVNSGTGTFAAGSTFAVGAQPFGATVLDADGDGHLDLVIANFADGTISTVRGTGSGSFATGTTTSIPGRPVHAVAADVNGDGHIDVAVVNFNNTEVLVLLGDGSGSWAAPVSHALGFDSAWGDVRDIDGDGKLDIIATNLTSNTVSVLSGDGAGGFAAQVTSPAAGGPFGAVVADFNGDGHLDVFYAGRYAGTTVLLPGNGTTSMGAGVVYPVNNSGPTPVNVVAGDFNEDGRPDLAVFDSNTSGGVTIMLSIGCTP